MKQLLEQIILFKKVIIIEENGDAVREAHRLHLSTRLPSSISIDQSFQKMIDNSSIYPFLKGLIN